MSDRRIFTVRPMIGNDLDAILAIEQESFSTPWLREHFEHEIAAPHSFPFVAACDGMIVGYVCMMSLFEEAQILDIAVAPEQRGRGVGRLLLEKAFATAKGKGAEVMTLEVRSSGAAAIGLYEKLGFSRVGVRNAYYDSSEDAILMEKIFKETT